jgi:hypothetical protein
MMLFSSPINLYTSSEGETQMDNKAILGTMQEVTKEKCPFLLKF